MNQTFVIGHKNPDVDSICSAIGYAALKREMGLKNFVAARCGNSNARIDRVLEKFGARLPQMVGDVRLRAKHAMRRNFISMPADASCFAVMDAIDRHDPEGAREAMRIHLAGNQLSITEQEQLRDQQT